MPPRARRPTTCVTRDDSRRTHELTGRVKHVTDPKSLLFSLSLGHRAYGPERTDAGWRRLVWSIYPTPTDASRTRTPYGAHPRWWVPCRRSPRACRRRATFGRCKSSSSSSPARLRSCAGGASRRARTASPRRCQAGAVQRHLASPRGQGQSRQRPAATGTRHRSPRGEASGPGSRGGHGHRRPRSCCAMTLPRCWRGPPGPPSDRPTGRGSRRAATALSGRDVPRRCPEKGCIR
jgi:hypothetical protein